MTPGHQRLKRRELRVNLLKQRRRPGAQRV